MPAFETATNVPTVRSALPAPRIRRPIAASLPRVSAMLGLSLPALTSFFDPSLATIVLTYVMFVYVVAQLANHARHRAESAMLESKLVTDVHKDLAKRDYHATVALFLLVNGWILTTCVLVGAAAIADISRGEQTLSAMRLLLWCAIMSVAVLLARGQFLRSYDREREQLFTTKDERAPPPRPFSRCWPWIHWTTKR